MGLALRVMLNTPAKHGPLFKIKNKKIKYLSKTLTTPAFPFFFHFFFFLNYLPLHPLPKIFPAFSLHSNKRITENIEKRKDTIEERK